MRHVLLGLLSSLIITVSVAQTAAAPDAIEIEERTATISKTLRCVVCQNQSIHDSNAPLASDMRTLVEKRVIAGDSDDEVREYLRERYGDFVLMSPPFQINTLLLWLGPALFVGAFAIWFGRRVRADHKIATESEAGRGLSEEERSRLTAALGTLTDIKKGPST